jgi:hypothetical protein
MGDTQTLVVPALLSWLGAALRTLRVLDGPVDHFGALCHETTLPCYSDYAITRSGAFLASSTASLRARLFRARFEPNQAESSRVSGPRPSV